jgi:sucrose-6-phosphate hydrolase SacC (GH32 family)
LSTVRSCGISTGDEKPLVCFYTSAGGRNRASKGQPFTQSIAYSNDRGRTFTKYEDNPIIGHINGDNRDPKVIWHEPTSRWVMLLYLDGHEMGFFTSKDLRSWEMTSKLKCFHECPELFELPIDGNEANRKWVLYGASGDYLLGTFDGRQFASETAAIGFSYGNCFYASQTFNDMPKSDGRRIQIGWARVSTPGMPFNQSMTFPVELTLRTTDEGVRLFAEPIRELWKLHARKHMWKEVKIKPGQNLLDGITGELFHIKVDAEVGQTKQFELVIRGTAVTYDVRKQQLQSHNKVADLKPVEGRIRLEILVDRTIIEIFANDGRIYMPMGGILPDDNRSLEVFTKSAETTLCYLEIYGLKSIWPQ